jgi:hypothetical protein
MKQELKRVQFDLGEMAFKELEAFKHRLSETSIANVIRTAIRLYEWMVRKRKKVT